MAEYHIGYTYDTVDPTTGKTITVTTPPIQQGSTYILNFTVTDVFGGTTANDLTLIGQFRPTIAGEAHTDFMGTIVSRANNVVTGKLTIDADTTAGMTANGKVTTGFWDCEIEDVNGLVIKPLGIGNKARVVPEVTRAAAL